MFTDIIFTGTGYVCHCCEEDVQAFLRRCQGKSTPQYCIGVFSQLCTAVSKNVMGVSRTLSCPLGKAHVYFLCRLPENHNRDKFVKMCDSIAEMEYILASITNGTVM